MKCEILCQVLKDSNSFHSQSPNSVRLVAFKIIYYHFLEGAQLSVVYAIKRDGCNPLFKLFVSNVFIILREKGRVKMVIHSVFLLSSLVLVCCSCHFFNFLFLHNFRCIKNFKSGTENFHAIYLKSLPQCELFIIFALSLNFSSEPFECKLQNQCQVTTKSPMFYNLSTLLTR